ncbi:MAG: hypothetical protein UR66_C0009G0062 [Candidatus Moranbacteria bacterium GW2011_GWE1_35_17]|nr:MAG: hypothetical protein UR66_C0009G0062 [Candidatus Moranbacteria bacterium GW2011_GWE1_35_17]KKP83131.1 MAG: hypothetical protein UR82_C0024G0009 [Candidatus Moranbacteria bacterium GW2011_GWF1_35_5]KKP83997.1 MAG: hypothetical protein UR83_C0029G0030 [Candidatus Moranbacteria bacterium GW2011_GWF2_35_54]
MNSESKDMKESYKNTIGWRKTFLMGVTFFSIAFLGYLSVYSEFDTLKKWIKTTIYLFGVVGVILMIPLIVFFTFETIKVILPKLTKPIDILIKIISKLFLFIKNIYIFITKLIIKEAVESIILEREKGREFNFIFKNQNDDDHYYPENIDLNKENIKIKVVPKDTKYWRIGFKFSNSEIFGVARHGMDLPLFHIGESMVKNSRLDSVENKDMLYVTYYNKDCKKEYDKNIMNKYKGELTIMEVFKNNSSTIILVKDKSGNELIRENIGEYRFCKLFAWGDKNNFILETKIWKENK